MARRRLLGPAVGAGLIAMAAAPVAHAFPAFPEPPCIVTGTGQCVPDTVWPIPVHGGHLHPVPPVEHQPTPPPGVITCIVNEGCFGHPLPVSHPDPGTPSGVDAPTPAGADDVLGGAAPDFSFVAG